MITRLKPKVADDLLSGLPFSCLTNLSTLTAASSSNDIDRVVGDFPVGEQRDVIRDALILILSGHPQEAESRALLYSGDIEDLASDDVFDLPDLVDSEYVRRFDPDHAQFSSVIKRFAESANFKSWMLYMHPDQEALVTSEFNGSAKLLGVSGSGKTCVLVRRAVELAARYPSEKILVLTLNPALSRLVSDLVSECTDPETVQRIDVLPFFELCRNLLLESSPHMERHYREVTWKGGEHIDEIWMEYYQCRLNNRSGAALQPVHDYLIAQGYDGSRYIREEFDWVRSACAPGERDKYIEMQRKGRAVGLLSDQREHVLKGLGGWEEKMRFVGGSDVLDVASQVILSSKGSIDPKYRCVLVDECQDFGNMELRIVRSLAKCAPDDLFLCGDAAQQVSSRYQRFSDVGIDIPGARSRVLKRNYRNSKDVLLAANEVLMENLSEEMIDREDFELLDPEYSFFEGTLPVMLQEKSPESELEYALEYLDQYVTENDGRKACLAIAGHSLLEIERWAGPLGFPVLNGTTDLDEGAIFVSDLEQTKGFEFDLVCVANLSAGRFPREEDPSSEWFRDLSRLYVAMTRAKLELVLSFSGGRSAFLRDVGAYVVQEEWRRYGEECTGRFEGCGCPSYIEDGDPLEEDRQLKDMTGAELLYTKHAIGLSADLIWRLRKLVDGRGLIRHQSRVRWRSMGDAAEDFRRFAVARRTWGVKSAREFSELCLKLGL